MSISVEKVQKHLGEFFSRLPACPFGVWKGMSDKWPGAHKVVKSIKPTNLDVADYIRTRVFSGS